MNARRPLGSPDMAKPADYFLHERREMLCYVPRSAQRILDVGCGDGRFGELLTLELPGAEVWGVEPSPEACTKASQVLHKVQRGPFDDSLPFPLAHFDVIIFNDSLEHFVDHVGALQLAHRLLRRVGAIVASIPNVRYWPHVQHYLLEGDWRYEAAGILDNTHLRFFTKKSIVRDFTETGFVVERMEGINPCWIGTKFKLLRLLFPRRVDDMPYQQFAVVARKRDVGSM